MKERLHRSHSEAVERRNKLAKFRKADTFSGEEFYKQIFRAQERLEKISELLKDKNLIDIKEKALLEAEGIYIRMATGKLNSTDASKEMSNMLDKLTENDKKWLESPSVSDRFISNLQERRNQVINPITGRLDVKN